MLSHRRVKSEIHEKPVASVLLEQWMRSSMRQCPDSFALFAEWWFCSFSSVVWFSSSCWRRRSRCPGAPPRGEEEDFKTSPGAYAISSAVSLVLICSLSCSAGAPCRGSGASPTSSRRHAAAGLLSLASSFLKGLDPTWLRGSTPKGYRLYFHT